MTHSVLPFKPTLITFTQEWEFSSLKSLWVDLLFHFSTRASVMIQWLGPHYRCLLGILHCCVYVCVLRNVTVLQHMHEYYYSVCIVLCLLCRAVFAVCLLCSTSLGQQVVWLMTKLSLAPSGEAGVIVILQMSLFTSSHPSLSNSYFPLTLVDLICISLVYLRRNSAHFPTSLRFIYPHVCLWDSCVLRRHNMCMPTVDFTH